MRPLGVVLIAVWFWLRSALGILLGLGIAVGYLMVPDVQAKFS